MRTCSVWARVSLNHSIVSYYEWGVVHSLRRAQLMIHAGGCCMRPPKVAYVTNPPDAVRSKMRWFHSENDSNSWKLHPLATPTSDSCCIPRSYPAATSLTWPRTIHLANPQWKITSEHPIFKHKWALLPNGTVQCLKLQNIKVTLQITIAVWVKKIRFPRSMTLNN